ncbi:archaeal flagellar protein FlaJ [Nanobdella aerobiophila]|uniref:Archaeal flagellar protein FlaJ n=1 Tax=Nanobdella aerobiophila TaxID=2586965 RepID=A0A915SAG9_9ARCH|nr:type II secretion system F family protein [Nanobdella aerobiophila]BBL45757.1 archaeal flagellar protein FlaJ [Nanobdella aerobiophila]
MNKKELIYIVSVSIFSILLIFLPFKINIFFKIGIITLLYLIYFVKYLFIYLEDEEMENNFPLFLRDLSYYLKIGQPLPIALYNLLNNSYGKKLDNIIKYIVSQMKYGNTFYEALNDVSNKIKNKEISEVLLNINEVMKNGGDLSNLLDTLSDSIRNLSTIRKDRLSQLKITTYTYYGLFFGVLLSLAIIYFLVLNLESSSLFLTKSGYQQVISTYRFISFILLLINAIFTGLVIGKISKGKIQSGIYHSIILVFISLGFFFLL